MRYLLYALAFSLFFLPSFAFAQERLPPHITLIGKGETNAVPDVATVQIGLVTQNQKPSLALEENTKQLNDAIAAIKAAGIEAKDLQTANFSLQPQYNRYNSEQERRIIGYEVRNTVIVAVHDLKKIGGLLDKVVGLGANSIDGPNFSLKDPEAAHMQAREAAMKDVQKNAALYAKGLGLKLGRIIEVSESFISAPRPMMASGEMMKAKAPTPIEAGEVSLNAQVIVTWELLP